jgi:hypothetical protein
MVVLMSDNGQRGNFRLESSLPYENVTARGKVRTPTLYLSGNVTTIVCPSEFVCRTQRVILAAYVTR